MKRAGTPALIVPVLLLALILAVPLPAGHVRLRSQINAWLALDAGTPSTPRLGLRWQPSLELALPLGGEWTLDGEFSAEVAADVAAPGWDALDADGGIDPYRLWLRLSSRRFEARLGLQQINFGSASVFRPLMWFDRVDARDPLKLTAGVYGLLLRYYFKGDANLWLWGLYGNTEPKGWESLPTARRAPELGGRVQVPLPAGEAAAAVHFRRVAGAGGEFGESRFAFDGKWDVGVGLWAEASFSRLDGPFPAGIPGADAALPWQRSLALGVDYTFGLGNGLYALAEQFLGDSAPSPAGRGRGGMSLTALLVRYPLGLLDTLSAIAYLDWRSGRTYAFAAWQRTLDRWQFHVMAFANPRQAPAAVTPARSAFAGWGFQLQAVWNI
jgi:hypothetical protein